jgi:hypothetical protein
MYGNQTQQRIHSISLRPLRLGGGVISAEGLRAEDVTPSVTVAE